MPSNSDLLADLDELIDLAERLRSANRIAAYIENDTRRDLVTFGRKQGSCEICGGRM